MKYFYLSLIFLSLLGVSLLGVAGNPKKIKIYGNVTKVKVPIDKGLLNLDQPWKINLEGIKFEYFVLRDETVVREPFGSASSLSGANFGEINSKRGNKFDEAFKFVANFKDSNFYGVHFSKNFDFTDTLLNGGRFSSSTFDHPNFEGKEITKVLFHFSKLTEPNFTKTRLDRVELPYTQLINPKLSGSQWENVNLLGTNFLFEEKHTRTIFNMVVPNQEGVQSISFDIPNELTEVRPLIKFLGRKIISAILNDLLLKGGLELKKLSSLEKVLTNAYNQRVITNVLSGIQVIVKEKILEILSDKQFSKKIDTYIESEMNLSRGEKVRDGGFVYERVSLEDIYKFEKGLNLYNKINNLHNYFIHLTYQFVQLTTSELDEFKFLSNLSQLREKIETIEKNIHYSKTMSPIKIEELKNIEVLDGFNEEKVIELIKTLVKIEQNRKKELNGNIDYKKIRVRLERLTRSQLNSLSRLINNFSIIEERFNSFYNSSDIIKNFTNKEMLRLVLILENRASEIKPLEQISFFKSSKEHPSGQENEGSRLRIIKSYLNLVHLFKTLDVPFDWRLNLLNAGVSEELVDWELEMVRKLPNTPLSDEVFSLFFADSPERFDFRIEIRGVNSSHWFRVREAIALIENYKNNNCAKLF